MRHPLLFVLLLFATVLFAQDSDLDGVSDQNDRCPNTPFTDLVDLSGCTKTSLAQEYHYDLIVGLSVTNSDYTTLTKTDTLATTFQADYYYNNFSFQFATSLYTTNSDYYSETGLQDSFIGVAYQTKPLQDLSIRFLGGAILPTYDTSLGNNKTDYTAGVNLEYNLHSTDFFCGYTFTMINDNDYADSSISVSYQNTNAYNLGVGYNISNKLYISGAYNFSDSIYVGVDKVETLSFYLYRTLHENYFTTFSYAYGLSESASENYFAVKLGYYF